LKAYPTVEMGDVIWAYMGPEEEVPDLPKFEWTQVPGSRRLVSKMWEECNWLQSSEGEFDPSHPAFLHLNLVADTKRAGGRTEIYLPKKTKQELELTDYGFWQASIRPLAEGKTYVNVNHFVMPFHCLRSNERKHSILEGHMVVPVDDENCIDYAWKYSLGEDTRTEMEAVEKHRGRGPGELTADFRKVRNKDNNWLIDRKVQKTETFTGIEGIHTQDHAVQESMGPIVDRTQEHLGGADKTMIELRSVLMQAVRTVQTGGTPPGVKPSYYGLRPAVKVLPNDLRWREELMAEIYAPGS